MDCYRVLNRIQRKDTTVNYTIQQRKQLCIRITFYTGWMESKKTQLTFAFSAIVLFKITFLTRNENNDLLFHIVTLKVHAFFMCYHGIYIFRTEFCHWHLPKLYEYTPHSSTIFKGREIWGSLATHLVVFKMMPCERPLCTDIFFHEGWTNFFPFLFFFFHSHRTSCFLKVIHPTVLQ